jgi:carbonic anhydrase/acetyltransferase-like protein (isoleucine patch superfamily)
MFGILLRRVWYRKTLKACGRNFTVDWLAVVRTQRSEVGHHCTLGVGNWISWVKLGNDVITGNNVTILSGREQHHFERLDKPIREQGGKKRQVVIGNDVWVGAHTIIMADVSPGTVIGAGSVVTHTYEHNSVLAGVPAKRLRNRLHRDTVGGTQSAMSTLSESERQDNGETS